MIVLIGKLAELTMTVLVVGCNGVMAWVVLCVLWDLTLRKRLESPMLKFPRPNRPRCCLVCVVVEVARKIPILVLGKTIAFTL